MNKLNGTLAALAAVTILSSPALAWASQTPSPEPTAQQAQETSTLRGELVKVDTDAMILVIKAADGKEHTFGYTDSTEVTGAQEGVAGLATKAGSPVTVHFTGEAVRTATKIEVEAEKQSDR